MSLNIKTVTIIGANGTMGKNVAAIYASFGKAKVYMVCRDIKKAQYAKAMAIQSVRADSIASYLIPADYEMMYKCISESDLIVEHLPEDLDLKVSIYDRLAKYIRSDAVICSGSSGLSITRLTECFDEEKRRHFFGVHMFNPPYSLTLCELISTEYSDMKLYQSLKIYLSEVLLRTVVEVKDSPAFLGNRIGFHFINKALQYAEKYRDNGGIDYIDAILGCYTGRAMAPLITSDFVGLDVHKAIVDNVFANSDDYDLDSFIFPAYAQKLVDDGKLGRKSGSGLYQLIRYDNGLKRMTVYDISSETYRDRLKYTFPFAEKMIDYLHEGSYQAAFNVLINNHSQEAEIALEFLLDYILYSLMASEKVGYSVHSADDVMAAGFNWCPPLAVRDALSTVTDFESLVRERLKNNNVPNLEHLFLIAEPSCYDYRIYFKSKS